MTDDDVDEMVKLYVGDELSTNEIALRFKILPAAVRYHLLQRKVEMRPASNRMSDRQGYDDEVAAAKKRLDNGESAADLYADGMSPTVIADAVGVTRDELVNRQIRRKVEMRPVVKNEIPDHLVPRLSTVESWYQLWQETCEDHGMNYGQFVAAANRLGLEAPGRKHRIPKPSALAALSAEWETSTAQEAADVFDVSVRTFKRWMDSYSKEELAAARKRLHEASSITL